MGNSAGHGHAQGTLAAAALAGHDEEVALVQHHGNVVQDGLLPLIVDVCQVLDGNEPLLRGLQVVHAVV